MKEFKGTKTPWVICKNQLSGRIAINQWYIDVWHTNKDVTREEAEANAKLIAAAPLILDELQEIVEYINKMGVVSMAMNRIKHRANNAINKALDHE